jgi:hypothetical protein
MKGKNRTHLAERFKQVALGNEGDERLRFMKVQEGPKRGGW